MQRSQRRLVVIAIGSLLFLTATSSSYAQLGLGQLVGTVRDPSGGVIPGADVVAVEVDTGVESRVITTSSGQYAFLNLSVGTYTVRASLAGFQTVEQADLRVFVGQALTRDFELPVGDVTQVVTVTAELVTEDTTSTTTGQTRLSEELVDLPLQVAGGRRNTLLFLKTLAGTGRGHDAFAANWPVVQGVGYSEGERSVVGYKVDGSSAHFGLNQALAGSREPGFEFQEAAVPHPQFVEEFRVVTNQDAEHGGDLGATVELVTKSGTNEFHGTLFEYARNDALDARNWFASDVSGNKQHEFGFIFGGPIVKNKHFFLFSYDGFRRTASPAGIIKTVPTALMRNGDFSEWLGPEIGTDALGRPVLQGQIFDPDTTRTVGGRLVRDPFPGNIIPGGRISSISSFFQQFYPSPTGPGLERNWNGGLMSGSVPRDGWIAKTDHELGAHRVSVYLEHEWSSTSAIDPTRGFGWLPPEVAQGGAKDGNRWVLRVNDAWTLRPNLLLSLRAGPQRGLGNNLANEESRNIGQQAGLTDTLNAGTPYVTIGARASEFGNWQPFWKLPVTTIPASVNLALVKGDHQFKFGADFFHQTSVWNIENWTTGRFDFSDTSTGQIDVDLTGGGGAFSGNAYGSFLLGEAQTGRLVSPVSLGYGIITWGIYAQDKIQLTPKLSISLGLRWDIFINARENHRRMASFDPNMTNSAVGLPGALTFWGEGAGRNGRTRLIDTVYSNLGPRLGFAYAWDPVTVVRAHYGLQFFPINSIHGNGTTTPFDGWGADLNPQSLDGITPAFDWDDGFPGTEFIATLPNLDPTQRNNTSLPYLNPNEEKVGSAHNIGFSIERQLPFKMLAKAAYVGKLTHNVWSRGLTDLNQMPLESLALGELLRADVHSQEAQEAGIAIPYAGFTGTVSQALRPFPHLFSIVQMNAMESDQLYHSLQMTLQKRFSHHLSLMASYTISKNMLKDGFFNSVPHTSLKHLAKSVNFMVDRPQIFNISGSYELPFGAENPVLRQFVQGWGVSAIFQYAKGIPVVVTGTRAIPTGGAANVNRLPGVPVRTGTGCGDLDPNDPNSTLYNVNAFSDPAPFEIGDTRVLPDVRTCGYQVEDFSIFKNFYFGERYKLQFGADFFNIFNRHYWDEQFSLSTSLGSPSTFGQAFRASDPRTIQFHLKLDF